MSEDEEDGPLPRVLSALLGLELYLDGLLDVLEPVLAGRRRRWIAAELSGGTDTNARTTANVLLASAGVAAAYVILTRPPLRRLAFRMARL